MPDEAEFTDAELALWRSFHEMRRRLDRALDRQFQRDSQLSSSEYEVLSALHDSAQGQLRIKDIATAVEWEKSRVSHLVTRMARRGLVSRRDCDADGRGSWIALSDEGRRTHALAVDGHRTAMRRYFFDVLAESDADVLKALSERMVGAIGCDAAPEDADPADAPARASNAG